MKNLQTINTVKEQFVWVCQQLYAKNLVHATSGNISCLDEQGQLLISPSGYCLDEVDVASVVTLDDHINNGVLQPNKKNQVKPSSEWRIHQAIYKARPEIKAVVHAHPPKTTALAITGKDLTTPYLAEAVVMLGPVPLVEYIMPGSEALADRLYEGFKNYNGLILQNHGVFAVGKDLREAYFRMELIESLAEMMILAHEIGSPQPLSMDDLQAIDALTG